MPDTELPPSPFDAGGKVTIGFTVPGRTLYGERNLTPAQGRAYAAAVELVNRWNHRGGLAQDT